MSTERLEGKAYTYAVTTNKTSHVLACRWSYWKSCVFSVLSYTIITTCSRVWTKIGLNKEIMATLKDCSPEMVKTLALASEMCSGTSEYKKTADYGHAWADKLVRTCSHALVVCTEVWSLNVRKSRTRSCISLHVICVIIVVLVLICVSKRPTPPVSRQY